MSITVALLPVYFRQRAAQFFPPWAFGLPAILLRIPYTMVGEVKDGWVAGCMVCVCVKWWVRRP